MIQDAKSRLVITKMKQRIIIKHRRDKTRRTYLNKNPNYLQLKKKLQKMGEYKRENNRNVKKQTLGINQPENKMMVR